MSSGFHRMGGNVPGKLEGFSNCNPVGFAPLSPTPPVQPAQPVSPATDPAHPETELQPERRPNARAIAIQQGYTGDICDVCSGVRMKVSGHCKVCEDCGTTTGCS